MRKHPIIIEILLPGFFLLITDLVSILFAAAVFDLLEALMEDVIEALHHFDVVVPKHDHRKDYNKNSFNIHRVMEKVDEMLWILDFIIMSYWFNFIVEHLSVTYLPESL